MSKTWCKFCDKSLDRPHRAWRANPYCSERSCIDKRLEAAGAIDLRDNYETIDHGNGYVSIMPIDNTKLWKASE